MERESIQPLADRKDFRPFKIITSAGASYDIFDPGGLAFSDTELFYHFPKSDRAVHIAYDHIAMLEETTTARKR
ncbi:MAG TPA: hypothetical protein VHM90_14805 [Phycisphaerae bacterium]|nr:hypothetical protein [Phycisphaerae bacterium]